MRQRAKIVQEVGVQASPQGVSVDDFAESGKPLIPIAELEDGRRVEVYDCHRFVFKGVEGWAELDTERNIWTFTEDPQPEIEPFVPFDQEDE